MRWKFLSCPWNAVQKSYVSCRPYCVGWRKYLHCSDAFTRCWHTDIHLLYFCTPDFIIWGLGSKVKATYEILILFIIISYRLNCFSYDCHNWWYICSFLHEDDIIVFQGQSSMSHVKHCCSCYKKYIMIGSARTANFDTHSYLKLKRKFIFCQGKKSYLNSSL